MKKAILIIASLSLVGCGGFPLRGGGGGDGGGEEVISSSLLQKARVQSGDSYSDTLSVQYENSVEELELRLGHHSATLEETSALRRQNLEAELNVEKRQLQEDIKIAREVALFDYCHGLVVKIEDMQAEVAETEEYLVRSQSDGVLFGRSILGTAMEFADMLGSYDAAVQQFEALNCAGFENFVGIAFPSYTTPGTAR